MIILAHGKGVVDFLLVLTKLFFARYYGWAVASPGFVARRGKAQN